MADKFDWSRFRLGVCIRATPDTAYRAWATAAGLVAWFPNAARKPTLYKITFSPNGEITVRISKDGKYSLVELIQNKIPTSAKGKIDSHMGCRTGWTFFLTNLKSVLEGGPDLRELDAERAKQTFLVNM
jgi:uncharacterized protein YndB with AHSA1/START domain